MSLHHAPILLWMYRISLLFRSAAELKIPHVSRILQTTAQPSPATMSRSA